MYTIEQIIEALQALNVTNETNAYAYKLASSGSAYASQITTTGSPLLVYISAATALASLFAIVVYYNRASSERRATSRKILDRKQTGFFRPRRPSTPTARMSARKLSAVEYLQIMEILANAGDVITTLEDETGEYHSDEELPGDIAESLLEKPFEEVIGLGSNDSLVSSLSVSVDSAEDVRKDRGYESECTSSNRGSTNPEQSEDGTQRSLSVTVNASSQDNAVAESGEGSQSLIELKRASTMSDDEQYTRRIGRSDSPDFFATANIPFDPPLPRRSSWDGEDNSKTAKPNRGKLETDLRANTSDKMPSRRPNKAPTFQPDVVIPLRRPSTKKSEVMATEPESSKTPGFTDGMIQTMAHYAAQSKGETGRLAPGHRRPQRNYHKTREQREFERDRALKLS